MRRTIGKICLVLGVLLILGSAGLVAYNLWDSYRAAKASDDILEKMGDIPTADDGDVLPLYKQYPFMDMPTKEIDGYLYIGVIEIPSKDIKLPVMEKWDYTRLKISPCRYSGSVYTNDIVIAGHNYLRHFTPIKTLEEGAKVIFTDVTGNVFNYEVAWTEVLQPKQTKAMKSESKDNPWDLTLFTCTTGGGSRFTVRCVLQSDEPADEETKEGK